jgi:hypothetical protein
MSCVSPMLTCLRLKTYWNEKKDEKIYLFYEKGTLFSVIFHASCYALYKKQLKINMKVR